MSKLYSLLRRNKLKLLCFLLPVVIGFWLPSFISFLARVISLDTGIFEAIYGVVEDQLAEGEMLFLRNAMGVIPFVALSAFLIFPMIYNSSKVCLYYCLCGMISISAFMVPVYYSYERDLYLGINVSSTGCLIYVFVPIYCIITLTIGLLVSQGLLYITAIASKQNRSKLDEK